MRTEAPFSYATAIDQLIAINREIKAKTFNPADWQTEAIKAFCLKNVICKWLAQREEQARSGELSPGTLKPDRSYVENYYIPMLGSYDVREIDYGVLEDFKNKLPSHLKLKTKRNITCTLHSFFVWLFRRPKSERLIKEMPIFPAVKGNDSKPRKALTFAAQSEAITKIPEEHRDIYEFETETGVRPGEACTIKISDIDFDAVTIRIQRTESDRRVIERDKEGHKKEIALSDRAAEIILKHAHGRAPGEWLFVNSDTGRRYTVKWLNLKWRAYSGTNITHYEGTRHSFATQIIQVTRGNIEAAKELLRHADLRSTQRYLHEQPEFYREVLNERSRASQASAKDVADRLLQEVSDKESVENQSVKWWRRWDSNPRPKTISQKLIHAFPLF